MKKFYFIAPLFLIGLLAGCGNTVKDPEAYKVTFSVDSNCHVEVYAKQDYSTSPTEATVAYSVDADSGAYLKDGTGQVNFKVVANDGYYVSLSSSAITYDTSLTEAPYSNLKGIGDDIYRITKISADLLVTINATSGTPEAYTVTFTVPEHVTFKSYVSSEAEVAESGTTAYSRDGDSGAYLNDGSGQVNFKISVDDGYYCNLGTSAITETTYSNFKACGDGWYRITKITGNLTVTLPVSDTEPTNYAVTFVGDDHCSITSYVSEEAAQEGVGTKAATTEYVREGTSGEIITDGTGKVYFLVVCEDGYQAEYVISGSYKNDKVDDGYSYHYLTKCTSAITITATSSLITA